MVLSFAAHLEALPVDERGLATISDSGCDIWSGRAYARVAVLVDGRRDESQVMSECDAGEREAVAAAIADLRRAGVLDAGDTPSEDPPSAAWWSSQRIAPGVAAERIRATTVSVEAIGDVRTEPTLSALTDAGLRVADEPELRLVLVDDYLDGRLLDINAQALESGARWMLAQPHGSTILIGPVFDPGAGPCWECLAQRLWLLRDAERKVRHLAGHSTSDHPVGSASRGDLAPPFTLGLGPSLLAIELTRWLTGVRPGLEALISSFDPKSWATAQHQVTWRPQCPACGVPGDPAKLGATPIRVRPGSAGQDLVSLRSMDPELTIRRFEHHVSPISGAVQTLVRMPGSDPMHVYVAGGPSARIHGDPAGWDGLDRLRAGGKGTSDALARASALCEALERYSGAFGGEEPRRTATFEDFGDAALHPNDYMRFSDRQYAERDAANARATSYRNWIPEPFDPRQPIEWSPCWSLTHEDERWLPTALLYYDADPPGTRFCSAESNGNAAGNTIEEAILHGMLELIERDHVAIWWYNRLKAPAVDLDTVDDPWLDRLRHTLAGQGRELWTLDLTADLGIPVAVALASSADGERIGIGLGAHLDLRRAVIRASTELVQLGLGAPSGGLGAGPDDLTLERYPFLAAPGGARVAAGSRRDEDVVAALETCRSAIEAQGIEVLVLDQTRPDIGLPVVKVIAPGLRHFWTRFGSGRLYDVPVAMGRLGRPRAEEELTPRAPTA